MFSLQRFLTTKSAKFFDLLEASTDEARESADALLEFIDSPQDQRTLDKFVMRRREEKRITEEITSLLCSSFMTPLEREDIEALSHALSRIPKTLKKFAERLLLSHTHLRADLFCDQARLLKQTVQTVCEMVRELRHGPRLNKIEELNARLHRDEGAADKLILAQLKDLYSGQYEALQMIVLRDLYELLEKVIDRCRDAGNVILQIALKNS